MTLFEHRASNLMQNGN